MVSIYTQTYNTKTFLNRCIDSVLEQTYSNFEYVLIDNGSTDGSKEILEKYAAIDRRIKLIRFETNRIAPIWLEIARETGDGRYITVLDSDDWWEPDYLERLVDLAERGRLDIVCTGSAFHPEGSRNATGARSLPQRLLMTEQEYPRYFAYYHAFFRTIWGKLIRREVFRAADTSIIGREEITNGSDTLTAFAWLRQAKRVCVDNSVLHHYLVRNKSVSRIYLPNRFKSNVVLDRDAKEFLSQYGPISAENRHFLHMVYANAVSDTLDVLYTSNLSPGEKLEEYCSIASHPTTLESYADTDEAIDNSRNKLFFQLFSVASAARSNSEAFMRALDTLCPKCAHAVTGASAELFRLEPKLLDALRRDDADALASALLDLIEAKRYTKQYNIGEMLCALASDKPLLAGVDDLVFLRAYRNIYWSIWTGKTAKALDEMTGLLLDGQVKRGTEVFLSLYLSLAATLEEIPAFLFGKTMLAEHYLRQGQAEDCQSVLDELAEMGVEDNETLSEIRRGLAELTKNT